MLGECGVALLRKALYRFALVFFCSAAAFAQQPPPVAIPSLPPGIDPAAIRVLPEVSAGKDGELPEQQPTVILYVNSKDAAHLNVVVENALRLAQKRRIALQTIYHIGDYRTLSPENAALAKKLGIRYEAATRVGYSRGITMSPTWIFVKNGEPRVVEGYMTIEPFIATEGLLPPAMKLDSIDKRDGELKGF
jgi:hypothetical protein